MLWKTHIAISNQVLKQLGIHLSYENYERYKAGVIAPDQWNDYPHHHGKSIAIINNLMAARQSFLQDRLPETFYFLGVAFHYIQDAYTSVVPYEGRNKEVWHHNYEQNIEDAPFVDDISKTIQYYFRDNLAQLNRYSQIETTLSQKLHGKNATFQLATMVGRNQSTITGKPIVDKNLALEACADIMESVLCAKTNSQIDTSLKQSLIYHQGLLQQTELSTAQEIVDNAIEIEQLKSKREVKSGVVTKLKNGWLGLRVRIKKIRLSSKYKNYLQKKHLFKISKMYGQATDAIIAPELSWYIFSKEELNLNNVKPELIPIQQSYRELIDNHTVNSYKIGNDEVVFRKELLPYVNF
jgi:hypothetical protein